MKTKISYASEEGLKELYRRAVSRIPDVDTELDYYSENPIANSTVTNALANLASYLVVPGTGSDHHPNIPSGTESEMVLYFVKVASEPGKDNYKEWIWTGKWECIGEPSIVVDDALNINSMNPITNHAVTEALLNFGGFEKVNGTGADHHPDVANPSTKVIYLVEVPGTPEPDHCMEWIWEASGKWVCIGSTSIDVDTELDPSSDNPVSNWAVCGGLAEKTDQADFVDAVSSLNDEIALKANQSDVDEAVSSLEDSISDLSTHVEGEIADLDTTKANKDELVITPGTGSDADKATIQLKANTSVTVLTAHQDISGKADCATTLAGYGITDAKIENTASNTVVTLGSNKLTVGLSDGRVNTIDSHTLFADRATNDATGREIAPNLVPDGRTDCTALVVMQVNGVTTMAWDPGEHVYVNIPDPYNPLNLPEYTIRLRYRDGVTPTVYSGTLVQVSSSPNVWDLTKDDGNWSGLLNESQDLIEVLGANAAGVTNMAGMFTGCTMLTIVASFNTSSVTSMGGMFTNCSALTSVPLFDTANVVEMGNMFSGCTSLTEVPQFNTGSVTGMSYMFRNCSSLTTLPVFDTASATTMECMFFGCSSLTTVPSMTTNTVTNMTGMFSGCASLTAGPEFDTGNVRQVGSMFNGCSSLASVPEYNLAKATSIAHMFYGCSSLVSVPVFDTSNVTSMRNTFANCVSLTDVPLLNTSKVTDMYCTFYDCINVERGTAALYQQASGQQTPPRTHTNTFTNCGSNTQTGAKELDLIDPTWGGTGLPEYTMRIVWDDSSEIDIYYDDMVKTRVSTNPYVWDIKYTNNNWSGMFGGKNKLLEVQGANIPKVTNTSEMFHLCNGLTKVSNFITNKLENIENMFMTCNALTEVQAFNTSNVTNMRAAFFRCPNLKYVPLLDTTKATDMTYMFEDCKKVESGALALYQQASSQANPPSSHYETFYQCGSSTVTGRAELAQIDSDWK